MSSQTQVRAIIRMAGRDLNGNKPLLVALRDIKGLNFTLALAIIRALRLDPSIRLGRLSDSQLQTLERAIMNPKSLNLPGWLLNRRKDIETGQDSHLLESDLMLKIKDDIEREKLMNSWRGFRHSLGLKVRGQRTRTTGRKGLTVGVRKKAVQAAQQAAQQPAQQAASEKEKEGK
ncbi:MAG: 30S ribosomal protein S13 [Nitrososphaeria archaeon]